MKIEILPETTRQPLTLIGKRAAVCWNSKSDPEKDYKRGVDCIISGHGRVMEFVNIEFIISEMSARAMRELYTHIAGSPTRLQASTRYINYSDLGFYIPKSLENNEDYNLAISGISNSYKKLLDSGIPKEDVANVLPLGMFSKMVEKCNLRMLENLMNQRLCTRAYSEMREFSTLLKKALIEYGSGETRNEWKEVSDNLFLPKCKKFGYCTETKSCGLMPKKEITWLT